MMYKANASQNHFITKIDLLLDTGCLEKTRGQSDSIDRIVTKIKITPKGRRLLTMIDDLNKVVSLDKLDCGIPYYDKNKRTRKYANKQEQKRDKVLHKSA